MRQKDKTEEITAVDIIEEATYILRSLPADIYALYYIGSLPFILGFLYFWADMSRGAFAYQYAAQAAFSVTVLYIWMKVWQAVFCVRLEANLHGRLPVKWTPRRILRLIVVQTSIQPVSLIALPVSSILLLPFAWVYAFFHNVSLAGNGKISNVKEVCREAWHQAKLFSAQNYIFIMIYFLMSICVFINIAIITYILPQLLSTFLGIETSFSRTLWGMLNTTLLMTAIGTSYLIINPLSKMVYVLRCFYGRSLQTGADLKVELVKYSPAVKKIVAAIFFIFIINFIHPIHSIAGTASNVAGTDQAITYSSVSSSELDKSISEVISKREYKWRMKKEKPEPKKEAGIIGKFISAIIDTIKEWLIPVKKWFKKIMDWILNKLRLPDYKPDKYSISENWMQSLRMVLYSLIAVISLILIVILWRALKAYRSNRTPAALPSVQSRPDITREETQADELPADGWLEMADNLMARGEFRPALRALYLATLSLLGRQKIIIIARFKSNKEYERELYRKAHHVPELLTAFSVNMHIFEGIWYGNHEVTGDLIQKFKENQARMTTIAHGL